MGLFIDGHLDSTPTHGAPLCQESAVINTHLRRLNRAGIVTDNSQPALTSLERDPETKEYTLVHQRGYVSGFVNKVDIDVFARELQRAGLKFHLMRVRNHLDVRHNKTRDGHISSTVSDIYRSPDEARSLKYARRLARKHGEASVYSTVTFVNAADNYHRRMAGATIPYDIPTCINTMTSFTWNPEPLFKHMLSTVSEYEKCSSYVFEDTVLEFSVTDPDFGYSAGHCCTALLDAWTMCQHH